MGFPGRSLRCASAETAAMPSFNGKKGTAWRHPVRSYAAPFNAVTSALSASIWTCCSCTALMSGAMNCS